MCGSSYDAAQWSALHLVNRLSAEEVSRCVISWPSDLVIEVRRCARCGRTMSHVTEDTGGHPSAALRRAPAIERQR